MENYSKLSKRSKNIFWSLKNALTHYKIDLNTLVFKIFGQNKQFLKRNEFEKIIRFGDLKVAFDEIDNVYEELQEKDGITLNAIQQQLLNTQSPYSALQNLEKEVDLKQSMLACLKQVKNTMIKEDPHYIFDLYDANKDGILDIHEFNNLLMGCCTSKQMDLEMRKFVLRVLLRKYKNNKMPKKHFFELFGLENIPKRVELPQPAQALLKHQDKEIANLYMMKSRAPKEVKKQFQQQMNLDNKMTMVPSSSKREFGKMESLKEIPIKQMPPIRPIPSTKQLSSQAKVEINKPIVPEIKKVHSIPSNPTPQPSQLGLRYYRLGSEAKNHPELIDLVSFYLMNKEVFVDDQSPATTKGEYLHAKDIFKTSKYSLFQVASSVFSREKGRTGLAQWIQPKDIIQGSLGDCYLLSSISSLVDYYPECISDLFLFDINPSGMYIVRLFNDGQWASIVLDDRFPCVNGKSIFAKPHGNQIWVLLLEKAWAKLHGSYQNIDMGSSMQALIALTGAPCKFHRKQDDDIKVVIRAGFQNGSVVTCSGSDELNELSAEVAEIIGLIPRHAYSVQKLVEVVVHGQKQLLIKIRNPWGNEEWNGDWCFKSPKWTDQLRKQQNYRKNPCDGSFYMPWQQFQKYFGSITICRIVPNSVCSSFRSTNLRHKSSYIKMIIRKKGEYTLSIYQQSKRKYQNTLNYELSESRLIILKVDSNRNYQYVDSCTKQASNLHLECKLTEGKYLLSCKVMWKHFDSHDCIITSYGPSNVRFKAHADRSIAPKFKRQMIQSFADKYPGEINFYSKLNIPEAYREVYFNINRGLGYIRVNNLSQKAFSTTVMLNKCKGIKVIKPDELPLKLSMMPQVNVVCGFFVSAKGYSYSLEEKMKSSV